MAALFVSRLPAADRLILRNLDILTERTVTALDEDGLVLDGPRAAGGTSRITWDEVERGNIALDQPRFDQLLEDLGPPLYRIRQRLKVGDYESLEGPAELLYPRFSERKGPTAYMVCQATMWSRLAAGKREAAVEPYLRCFELSRAGTARAGLPGERRLQFDAKTAMSPELLPIWFDPEAAKAALPGVQQAIREMTQPRPEGSYIYYASLALAAGEPAELERVLPSIRGDEPLAGAWRDILLAQQEVLSGSPGVRTQALRSALDTLPAACRPAALYWLGLAGLQSADEDAIRDGILQLLTLPASYAAQHPDLAAAGLYHAAAALDKLKDDAAAAAVRHELTSRFGATHHGAKLRLESKP